MDVEPDSFRTDCDFHIAFSYRHPSVNTLTKMTEEWGQKCFSMNVDVGKGTALRLLVEKNAASALNLRQMMRATVVLLFLSTELCLFIWGGWKEGRPHINQCAQNNHRAHKTFWIRMCGAVVHSSIILLINVQLPQGGYMHM